MIDLILLGFTVGVFYGGFWLGSKYQTVSNLFSAAEAKVASWFK